MNWETAKNHLHNADLENIKYEARRQGFKLSGKDISTIFSWMHENGGYTDEDMISMERDFEASIEY